MCQLVEERIPVVYSVQRRNLAIFLFRIAADCDVRYILDLRVSELFPILILFCCFSPEACAWSALELRIFKVPLITPVTAADVGYDGRQPRIFAACLHSRTRADQRTRNVCTSCMRLCPSRGPLQSFRTSHTSIIYLPVARLGSLCGSMVPHPNVAVSAKAPCCRAPFTVHIQVQS